MRLAPSPAADQPFATVQFKLREHCGFAIGESTIQRITLGHAKVMHDQAQAALLAQTFPQTAGERPRFASHTPAAAAPASHDNCQ